MKSNILKDALEVKCFSFTIQKPCMICLPEPDCQGIRDGKTAWEEVIKETDGAKEEASLPLLFLAHLSGEKRQDLSSRVNLRISLYLDYSEWGVPLEQAFEPTLNQVLDNGRRKEPQKPLGIPLLLM